MKTEIINIIGLSVAFMALFGLAELLYHFAKIQVEYTRKMVHLGTGLLTLLFPVLLQSHWSVLWLCASFSMLLFLSLRYRFLPSINAIERKSVGSLAYPLAVYVCFLAYEFLSERGGADGKQLVYFYLPILILAICDPLAALLGKRFPYGKFNLGKEGKTLVGSGAFFGSAMLVTVLSMKLSYINVSNTTLLFQSAIIALVATIAEGLSGKGLDNITIPVAVLFCLSLLEESYDEFNLMVLNL